MSNTNQCSTPSNAAVLDEPLVAACASSAKAIVEAFAKETGIVEDGAETQLSDLLCNLMHYADTVDLDFYACIDRARRHYHDEVDAESDD